MAPNPRRLDARLDALYAELPGIDCRGLCSDSCGPIAMSIRERERIERDHGKIKCPSTGARCSMLTPERRCGVYDIRPLICRLWGLTESLPCPYGCKPERKLTDQEAWVFLKRAEEIGGRAMPTEELQALKRLTELDPETARALARATIHRPHVAGREEAMPKTVIEVERDDREH